jgi:hypothetical protein
MRTHVADPEHFDGDLDPVFIMYSDPEVTTFHFAVELDPILNSNHIFMLSLMCNVLPFLAFSYQI